MGVHQMPERQQESSPLNIVSHLFRKLGGLFGGSGGESCGNGSACSSQQEEESKPCCEGVVHIAYRGVSDDRLYVAYRRKWDEVKFFRPRGLRVFCTGCRRRLL